MFTNSAFFIIKVLKSSKVIEYETKRLWGTLVQRQKLSLLPFPNILLRKIVSTLQDKYTSSFDIRMEKLILKVL